MYRPFEIPKTSNPKPQTPNPKPQTPYSNAQPPKPKLHSPNLKPLFNATPTPKPFLSKPPTLNPFSARCVCGFILTLTGTAPYSARKFSTSEYLSHPPEPSTLHSKPPNPTPKPINGAGVGSNAFSPLYRVWGGRPNPNPNLDPKTDPQTPSPECNRTRGVER